MRPRSMAHSWSSTKYCRLVGSVFHLMKTRWNTKSSIRLTPLVIAMHPPFIITHSQAAFSKIRPLHPATSAGEKMGLVNEGGKPAKAIRHQ